MKKNFCERQRREREILMLYVKTALNLLLSRRFLVASEKAWYQLEISRLAFVWTHDSHAHRQTKWKGTSASTEGVNERGVTVLTHLPFGRQFLKTLPNHQLTNTWFCARLPTVCVRVSWCMRGWECMSSRTYMRSLRDRSTFSRTYAWRSDATVKVPPRERSVCRKPLL